MSDYYTLKDKKVIPCDEKTWAKMIENIKLRRVAVTKIGKLRVSTVFLGIDYSFGIGPKKFFETLIFNGPLDMDEEYYSDTWEESEITHAEICKRVSDFVDKNN